MASTNEVDSNLRWRLITGLSLAAIAAGILALASYTCFGRWMLFGLVVVAVGLAIGEFARICWLDKKRFLQPLVYFAAPFCGIAAILAEVSGQGLCETDQIDLFFSVTMSGLAGVVVGFFLGAWYMISSARRKIDDAQMVAADLFPGILFLGLGGIAAVTLAIHPQGFRLLLWLILVVASGDSAAFFVGSHLKGPRLSPVISPGKTWSGTFGGLMAGALLGGGASSLLGMSLFEGLVAGALLQAVSQIGDLMKSYIKRLHSVKDSGTILPGHGGVLDRIDGMLAGALLLRFIILPWFANFTF